MDRQIDQLVYELYGLTDDEIALVEASTATPTRTDAADNDSDEEDGAAPA